MLARPRLAAEFFLPNTLFLRCFPKAHTMPCSHRARFVDRGWRRRRVCLTTASLSALLWRNPTSEKGEWPVDATTPSCPDRAQSIFWPTPGTGSCSALRIRLRRAEWRLDPAVEKHDQ